jgi:hypothetical protein
LEAGSAVIALKSTRRLRAASAPPAGLVDPLHLH